MKPLAVAPLLWSPIILGLLLCLSVGCSGTGGPQEPSDSPRRALRGAPPSTVVVDPSVRPAASTFPPRAPHEAPRALGRLVDDQDTGADFVLGELVVTTSDREQLEAALQKWDGRILDVLPAPAPASASNSASTSASAVSAAPEPSPSGATKQTFLVGLSLDKIDTAGVVKTLTGLSPNGRSDLRLSDAAALSTLSAGAELAAAGFTVGMQWIGQSSGMLDRQLSEGDAVSMSPSFLNSFPRQAWSNNPFVWPHLRAGGAMNFGVAEAWRVLAATGKNKNRVKLAVIDGGFANGHGLPGGSLAISTIPFREPLGTPNTMKCSGKDCDWHGTHVAQVAAAVGDDSVGIIGTGAPVVDLVMVTTLGDMFTFIAAYDAAAVAGARIITTSITVPVPWYVSWSILPLEARTKTLALENRLLFAAAGNDSRNVDAESCFLGICWEKAWVYPCENDGVHCIGGTSWGTQSRDSSSAYGDQVPLYGPYTLFVGSDPATAAADLSKLTVGSGTSYSTPFVAGIAALVWAVDPGASAQTVWSTLVDTANVGDGLRSVNAFAAVRSRLPGTNLPPSVRIVAPAPGARFNYLGLGVSLSAEVSDVEDNNDALTVSWSTPQEGVVATGAEAKAFFPAPGTRVVTVTVRDRGGLEARASVSLVLENSPPQVTIVSPTAGASVVVGFPFVVSGRGMDPNEALGGLDCARLRWSLTEDPSVSGTGCNATLSASRLGAVHLVLEAVDAQGALARSSTVLQVEPPPATEAPLVRVLDPVSGSTMRANASQPLTATATDRSGTGLARFVWTVRSPDGAFADAEVGTGASLTWVPADFIHAGSRSEVEAIVRCEVTDNRGNVASDEVRVSYFLGIR